MTDVFTPQQANRLRVNGLALLPAIVVTFVVVLLVAGAPVLVPLLVGAGGWLIALVLRQPVALLASRKLSKEATATLVGWFSGPAEEIVRLVLVLLTLHAVKDAVWFGWGWAAIEIVLVVVNVLALATLVTKDDPKSREAREMLAAQGMLKEPHPLWGFVERLSATAMHMGFTLMLFAQPWLVLVTLPVHSVTNMLAVKFGKTHIALTELCLALVGAAGLACGILLLA